MRNSSTISRPIRSFVNREGRQTFAQRRAYEMLWPHYGLEISNSMISFSEIFQKEAPVILEIGFGMGNTLFAMAKQHPENHYIGIEVYRTGIGALLLNIEKNPIQNIRIFRADAVEVLQRCIPDCSITTIQIFFPDPWPKKRHHKRRLIQIPFIQLIHRKLIDKGTLHLATDWENYANHMRYVLKQVDSFSAEDGDQNSMHRPITKYEQRSKKFGHQIFDLIFRKT